MSHVLLALLRDDVEGHYKDDSGLTSPWSSSICPGPVTPLKSEVQFP